MIVAVIMQTGRYAGKEEELLRLVGKKYGVKVDL